MSSPLVTPNLLAQMKQAQGLQALAAPVAPPLSMPAPALSLSGPSLPSVVNQPSPSDMLHRQLSADQAERDRRVNSGSGVDQIQNPLLRGIARAGDIAASIFAPGIARSIPGTTLHHQVLVNQAERNLANDQATQKAATAEQDSEAQVDQRKALAQQEQAKADALRDPHKAVDPSKTVQTDDGVFQLNPDTGKYDIRVGDKPEKATNLTQLHANAVQKAIQEGRDPSQDPTVNHLANAIIGLQPGQNKSPVLKESQPIIGEDGKPHVYELDEQGNKVKDLGVHYERPTNINVNAGETRQAKNDVLKAYQPTLDSGERFNVMAESYEKAVKDHDQQAMLNLLANHLGMTMGLQKGARITKDLYQEAAHSTPWLQKVGAQFSSDGYLSGVTLNPNQMRQMVDLAQSRYSEDVKKSRATASYLGAQDDGPQRVPNSATIRFYVGKANGDSAKAKQLAAADGWSVR